MKRSSRRRRTRRRMRRRRRRTVPRASIGRITNFTKTLKPYFRI